MLLAMKRYSNTPLQSPKTLFVSNSNKLVKEKCKSSCDLTSKSCHSRSTESIDDIIVNIDSDEANDSMFEIRNTENMDAADNTSKLAVETDSLSEPILNISSDKNVPLKKSSVLSSCERLDERTDDEKLTETSIAFNKETTEVHNEESNEIVNDSTISIVEKAVNANEESGKDNIKSNTSMNDQDDVREEVNKPDTLGNVQNDDEISCTNTCSSPNLTNTAPSTSPHNMSAANTECSPILKNKETFKLKSINKTNTLLPNTNGAKSTNADQDSVTDVVKSSPFFIATETPTELDEGVPKKEEPKEKESVNDSSMLKNKLTEKSESDEQKSESIQETCNKNQGSEAAESNDSDITATDLFQDIPATEWKEKNTDVDKNSMHLVSTERFENEMETKYDFVLIDKEAWLAAENMKAATEKEASDYDSDDTVMLKMRRDSVKAQKNEKTKMNKSADKMNDSKNATSDENDIDNEATNTKNFKDKRENEYQDKSITEQRTEHSTSKHNVSSRKLLERKSLNESHKITEAEKNLSESIPKKQKSLNKSTSKADVSRKSIQKEMGSEGVIRTSARKGKEKRTLNISSKIQRNSIEESDTEAKDSSASEKQNNAKKKFSRKRSAIRSIESSSDDSKSESDDLANEIIELRKLMLSEASNTDSNECDKSMDPDGFYIDDDDGDELKASETESWYLEDNACGFENFIVYDVEESDDSDDSAGRQGFFRYKLF